MATRSSLEHTAKHAAEIVFPGGKPPCDTGQLFNSLPREQLVDGVALLGRNAVRFVAPVYEARLPPAVRAGETWEITAANAADGQVAELVVSGNGGDLIGDRDYFLQLPGSTATYLCVGRGRWKVESYRGPSPLRNMLVTWIGQVCPKCGRVGSMAPTVHACDDCIRAELLEALADDPVIAE